MSTQFCNNFCTAFCCCIKYISMKDPGHLSIYFHYHFICKLKIAELYIAVAAQHFIVVASNVYNPCSFTGKVHDFFYHLHVRCRKISFVELPAIDNIAVENKYLWGDTFKVVDQLFCMAT